MTIVDATKLGIGILFALVGVGILVLPRGQRGFGQRRQVGAAVFVSVGLGWLDL